MPAERAAVRKMIRKSLARLANCKDNVRRQCRTALQSRAETLQPASPPDIQRQGNCTSHPGFGLEDRIDGFYCRGMIGGIGMLFFGMWLLSENLKTLTGPRIRTLVARLTATVSSVLDAMSWRGQPPRTPWP